jgi:hypothetical protein
MFRKRQGNATGKEHLKLVVAVDSLEVNDELLGTVADDKDTNGTGAAAEGIVDLLGEVTLSNNSNTSLQLTGLGLEVERDVLTSLDDLVLLEGWGQHGVEDDRWRWVADNAVLLDELVGEEINTKVSVLTSGSRGGDADDLGWSFLEDDQVTDTKEVAWDGEVGLGWWGDGLSWWRTERSNWLVLGDGDGLNWSVSILRLGVVALRNLLLGGLDWVEELINLLTEELGVVVVAFAVGRHFGRRLGGLWCFWLASFLGLSFFLDVDDLRRRTIAVFWGFTFWARSLRTNLLFLLVEVYVDLFDVSWLRNVEVSGLNLWLRTADKLLFGSRLGVVRRLGFDFGFWDLDTNVFHVTVEFVRVVVDGVELLVTWVGTERQRGTSS